MAQALCLAEKGLFSSMPNPRVGCVIVQDQTVVGEGWHARAGEAHAEVNALRMAGERARHATVYVTLEPCSHFGRTPPCSKALIKAGVRRVVVAMQDPNPLVAGRGLEQLRHAGIQVSTGIQEESARRLNEGFIARMERGRPWLRIKSATSLDGRTALSNGQSQWITGEIARADAQLWRARSCAILTGIGTVLADNPRLTVRGIAREPQPLRVIVDSLLKTPLDALVLANGRALIATTIHSPERFKPYQDAGIEILSLPGPQAQVDLPRLMQALAERNINEVLTEAGPRLNGALISAGCADALLLYIAPSLLGNQARPMFALPDLNELSNRWNLHYEETTSLGADLRILARFQHVENSVHQS